VFEQILSEAAKAVIAEALKSSKYDKRAGEMAPPYMAPSVDPRDYPQVCTASGCNVCCVDDACDISGAQSAMTSVAPWSCARDVESLCVVENAPVKKDAWS
jgi:hypothetical protein